ncbi:MAG: prenyltransferase [Coriobacteriia bacterium]
MAKWFLETRPQFLILSVLLVAHGAALAYWQMQVTGAGTFRWDLAVLAMVGLVLLHASSNVLNDWHDFARSGIDKEVRQTPFSGGSGLIPAGVISVRGALILGLGTLAAGTAIGLYLAWTAGWPLMVIGAIGVISMILYTPILTRIGLGELFAGLCLGTLPVVGVYFLLTGRLDTVAWVSGIPAGLLTYNLLLLNEFPDTDADTEGGRRHLVIQLGKSRARWLYAAVEILAFVAIAVSVALGVLTPWALLAFLAAIMAVKAIIGTARNYGGFEEIIPAMGANVMTVLGLNALLASGYLVAALTQR